MTEKAETPPRGRPRGFDRETALAAATRLFRRKGYSATSVNELTAAMGIAAPSLYAAFGDKEALYAEALRHFARTVGARLMGPFEAASTARGAVAAWLEASARCLPAGEEPGGCMLSLSSAASEGCAAIGLVLDEYRAAGFGRLRERLADGVAVGEIAPDVDLDALARTVLAVQQGMSLQARDGATEAELVCVARTAMAAFDALAAPPAAAPSGPSGRG